MNHAVCASYPNYKTSKAEETVLMTASLASKLRHTHSAIQTDQVVQPPLKKRPETR